MLTFFVENEISPKRGMGSTIHTAERKSKDHSFATSLEAIELRKEKNTIKRDLKETKQQFEELLFSKINIVKSSFGKPRLRLDMSVEELEALKEKIKNT